MLLIAAVGGVILGSHSRDTPMKERSSERPGRRLVPLASPASCSRTGALGVLIRRSPLIVLLSLEIMLNGANLAADRLLAPLRAG